MSKLTFLFNLDTTITKKEILTELAVHIGKYDKMCALTERAMLGELPFRNSFLERVELLKQIPVEKAQAIINDIPLNESAVRFLRENRERCYIVTGNLNVWIYALLQKINMLDRCFSSTAAVESGLVCQVQSVIDKLLVARSFVTPIVSIGDGNNDAELAEAAAIGVAFGGVRPIAYSLLCNCHYAVYDENRLYALLNRLL